MSAILTDLAPPTDSSAGIGHVVLGRTPRGDVEAQRALFPLSAAQRDLLLALDGRRSLRQLVATQPTLRSARLARDAARLLAFGLVKQLRGELPRELVVSSMNLTMKLPAEAFRPLAKGSEGRAQPPAQPAPPQSGSSRLRMRIGLALGASAAAGLLAAFWLLR